MRTKMDYLVLENCVLTKADQLHTEEGASWKDLPELD
jgi:hypothetical protein